MYGRQQDETGKFRLLSATRLFSGPAVLVLSLMIVTGATLQIRFLTPEFAPVPVRSQAPKRHPWLSGLILSSLPPEQKQTLPRTAIFPRLFGYSLYT